MQRMRVWAALVVACFVCSAGRAAEDKKEQGKDEPKKGTVTGVVTAKGDNFIEIKADGEEKGRRYVPNWVGGAPAQGGGPDKAMLEVFKKLTVGSRIKLDWKFEERPRAVKVEVLKAAGNGDKK